MKIIGYAVLLLLISCPLFASNPVLPSTAETVVPYRLSEQEKKDGYRLLFDGTTLDGLTTLMSIYWKTVVLLKKPRDSVIFIRRIVTVTSY